MNLRPGENFPCVWIPDDPADSATYYPQAVWRNATSQAIIATVNLTKQSNGSYLGTFPVPMDGSGLGFYVVVTVKVYTDSGHTTLSTTYAQTQLTYKVKEELQNFGGHSVDTTDYNYIEKSVKKIVEEAVKQIHFEQKETDLSKLEKLIIKILENQDPHGIALQLMDKKLENLEKKEIVFPKGEYEGHFSTLNDRLLNMFDKMTKNHGMIEPMVKKHLDGQHISDHEAMNKSQKEIRELVDVLRKELIDELKWRFDNVESMVYRKGIEPKTEPKKKEIDYQELAKNFL